MQEHVLWVTVLANRLLGKPALLLLSALHIKPADAEYPIPNFVAMELLVFIVAATFFLWLRSRLSVDRPGATQQCTELVITNTMGFGVRDMLQEMAGHGSEKYTAMLGSIGLFVLFCNLISIFPTLASPTASVPVPLGCAIVVFLYYNWSGIRTQGILRYAFQFVKMPIEIVSHSARLLSLTVRLWANMFVSELLYSIFLGLTLSLFLFLGKWNPIGYLTAVFPGLTVVFILLHIFVGILQAFVFTILPVIYVGGAVAEGH